MSLINENSTTKEVLSEIRYTFMVKEFEEYQDIVVRREEDLKASLNKLKEDYDLLKEERDLLERNHCSSELEKLELEEELKKFKNEFDSLKKKRCLSELELQFSDQKTKKPKIETDEKAVMELRRENEKLKEENELYRKKFPEHVNRIACIEEMLADLAKKNALNFRAENVDDDHHSPDLQKEGGGTPITGPNVHNSASDDLQRRINAPSTEAIFIEPAANDVEVSRNYKENTEIQSSHPQKEGGDTPITGFKVHNSASDDLQRRINVPSIEAIFFEPAANVVEVSLSTAPVNRAEPPIIVVDSDSSDIDSDDLSIVDPFMQEIVRKR